MNVFSLYVPGDSIFHRLATGWKYLIMAAATFSGLFAQNVFVSLGLLIAAMLALFVSRTGLRYSWKLPIGVWIVVTVMALYQVIVGHPITGVIIATNLVMAIYFARLLTMTTPGPVLVDTLISALGWLRILGLDPERIGLAVALMVRSLPVLLDSFNQVRDAAIARGRERNFFALVTPVVVRAVGYAQATGQAMSARGLGDG